MTHLPVPAPSLSAVACMPDVYFSSEDSTDDDDAELLLNLANAKPGNVSAPKAASSKARSSSDKENDDPNILRKQLERMQGELIVVKQAKENAQKKASALKAKESTKVPSTDHNHVVKQLDKSSDKVLKLEAPLTFGFRKALPGLFGQILVV